MAQRTDEVLEAAYEETINATPTVGVPMPATLVIDQLSFEVLLDIRERLTQIYVALGGAP